MGRKKRETDVSTRGEMPTLAQVKAITDQYAESPLECDGLTNVLHFYLTRAQIEHRLMEGCVQDAQGKEGITWHRWIAVQAQEGPAIVDYRARMWLGRHDHIPHGVFLRAQYSHMQYQGEEIEPLPLSEAIIRLLVERTDIPPEWREQYKV